MKHDDHYHCDACGAEFRTESELEEHNKAEHSPEPSSSSASGSRLSSPGINDKRMPIIDEPSEREGRSFDRSHEE